MLKYLNKLQKVNTENSQLKEHLKEMNFRFSQLLKEK
jgi:hypothetical protein